MAFFKLVPNITIMAPKDFEELTQMMDFAITLKAPVVIRYPRGGEADIKFEKHEKVELGKAEILQEGEDVTIIGIGKMTATAMKVSKMLEKDGINAEVINAKFLKPLDESTIKESGGLGSSVKELIVNKNIEEKKKKSFAYPDEFIKHGSVPELEKVYGLDCESICDYVRKNVKEFVYAKK